MAVVDSGCVSVPLSEQLRDTVLSVTKCCFTHQVVVCYILVIDSNEGLLTRFEMTMELPCVE